MSPVFIRKLRIFICLLTSCLLTVAISSYLILHLRKIAYLKKNGSYMFCLVLNNHCIKRFVKSNAMVVDFFSVGLHMYLFSQHLN